MMRPPRQANPDARSSRRCRGCCRSGDHSAGSRPNRSNRRVCPASTQSPRGVKLAARFIHVTTTRGAKRRSAARSLTRAVRSSGPPNPSCTAQRLRRTESRPVPHFGGSPAGQFRPASARAMVNRSKNSSAPPAGEPAITCAILMAAALYRLLRAATPGAKFAT